MLTRTSLGSLAKFLRNLFGMQNFVILGTGSRLTQQFNSFVGNKLIIMADESEGISSEWYAFVKHLSGSDWTLIESKHKDAKCQINASTIFAACNAGRSGNRIPISITPEDRRVFASSPGNGLIQDVDFFRDFTAEIADTDFMQMAGAFFGTIPVKDVDLTDIPNTLLRQQCIAERTCIPAIAVQRFLSHCRDQVKWFPIAGPLDTNMDLYRCSPEMRRLWCCLESSPENCRRCEDMFTNDDRRVWWSYKDLWSFMHDVCYNNKAAIDKHFNRMEKLADFLVEETALLDPPYRFLALGIDGKDCLAFPSSRDHCVSALKERGLWSTAPTNIPHIVTPRAPLEPVTPYIPCPDLPRRSPPQQPPLSPYRHLSPRKRQRTGNVHSANCSCHECNHI